MVLSSSSVLISSYGARILKNSNRKCFFGLTIRWQKNREYLKLVSDSYGMDKQP